MHGNAFNGNAANLQKDVKRERTAGLSRPQGLPNAGFEHSIEGRFRVRTVNSPLRRYFFLPEEHRKGNVFRCGILEDQAGVSIEIEPYINGWMTLEEWLRQINPYKNIFFIPSV